MQTISNANQENQTKETEEQPTNQPQRPLNPVYPSYYPWPQYNQQYIPQSPYPVSQVNGPNYPPPPNVPTFYVPVETEYQGVLVPINTLMPPPPPPPSPSSLEQTQHQPLKPQSNGANKDNRIDNRTASIRNNYDLAVILQALLPPNVLQMIVAWANFILNSFSMMAFAGLITSAICSLTPICTLTFGALPLSVRQNFMAKMSNEDGSKVTTIQRVRRAADMVSNALKKYEKLQEGVATIKKTLDKSMRS